MNDEERVDEMTAEEGGAAEPSEDAAAEASEQDRAPEELASALAEAERQRDAYLDDLQRAQAEFQNFRKRAMREGAEQRERGVAEVLTRLLDVVDDFELAVLAVESAADAPDAAALRRGVEMVYGKLVDALRSFGLEKIDAEDVAFDPEIHDAVQQVDSGEERETPVVAEVLRPGYRVGDRVLRAAMVKVAR